MKLYFNFNFLLSIFIYLICVSKSHFLNEKFKENINLFNENISNLEKCPCQNNVLCLPLEKAKSSNSTATHVLQYIKKQSKTQVSHLTNNNRDVQLIKLIEN